MTAEHLVNAVILLSGVFGLEWVYHLFWKQDALLFDKIPVRYLFDGMEFGVIGIFVVGVILQALKVFGFKVPWWLRWLDDE